MGILGAGALTPLQERAQQAAQQLAALEQEMQQMQLAQVSAVSASQQLSYPHTWHSQCNGEASHPPQCNWIGTGLLSSGGSLAHCSISIPAVLLQGELSRRNQALETALGVGVAEAAAVVDAAAAAVEPFAATAPEGYGSSGSAAASAGAAVAAAPDKIPPAAAIGGSDAAAASNIGPGGWREADADDGSRQPAGAAGSWKLDIAAELGIGGQLKLTVRRGAELSMTWRKVRHLTAAGVALGGLWA